MSFTLSNFVALRPFLYHLTFLENLDSILSTRRILPAAHFLGNSSGTRWNGIQRGSHVAIERPSGKVFIRDQSPLQEGHIAWEQGWDLPRFVNHLNEHVFFWPGGPEGPIRYGRNHLERYRTENPILLKISTADLIGGQSSFLPKFCPWNSGAPRISNRKKCSRGGQTFLTASEANFTAGKVAEVVFRGGVGLPYTFEYLNVRDSIWRVDYASCVSFDENERTASGLP